MQIAWGNNVGENTAIIISRGECVKNSAGYDSATVPDCARAYDCSDSHSGGDSGLICREILPRGTTVHHHVMADGICGYWRAHQRTGHTFNGGVERNCRFRLFTLKRQNTLIWPPDGFDFLSGRIWKIDPSSPNLHILNWVSGKALEKVKAATLITNYNTADRVTMYLLNLSVLCPVNFWAWNGSFAFFFVFCCRCCFFLHHQRHYHHHHYFVPKLTPLVECNVSCLQ